MEHYKVTIEEFNKALRKAIKNGDEHYIHHLIHDFRFDESHAMPKVDFRRATDKRGKERYGV